MLSHGIVHGPQDVEFELQHLQRPSLLLASLEMSQRHGESMIHIALCQRDTAAEILQPVLLDPRIVFRPRRQSLAMNRRGEQLRQRRAHCFLPGRLAREIHIRIDGEAHAWNQPRQSFDFGALQTHGFGQTQPGLDAARIVAMTVVIQNALDP
jgi:hypothetical protein